jgi:hypothetical protein
MGILSRDGICGYLILNNNVNQDEAVAAILTAENKNLFYDNKKSFWYKKVFGYERVKSVK